MSKSILVCDKDKDYISALTAYLMSLSSVTRGFIVTGISDEETLNVCFGEFDTALISEEFLPLFKSNLRIKTESCLILKESRNDSKDEDSGEYFKYQSMDTLVSILSPNAYSNLRGEYSKEAFITGVYSPSRHELSLPYALCLCKELSAKGKTLFLDLSEIGILSNVIGESFREDLIDLIFMLENQGVNCDIGNFIKEYEGIFILSPALSPSQFSYITPAQWKALFLKIKESGFFNVVVLFGNLIQGFTDLTEELKTLMVIRKPGEFYSLAEGVFMNFMEKVGLSELCKEVTIPLSISGGLQGPFRMSGLINGKLKEYVRVEDVA